MLALISSKFRNRFNGPLPTRGVGSFPMRASSSILGTLTNDVVGNWKCNEAAAADNFVDSSVNGLTLTKSNNPGVAAGKIGGCRTFTAASSQSASSADHALLKCSGRSWSVNFWAYFATVGAYRALFSKDDLTSQREIVFDIGSDDRLVGFVNGGGGNNTLQGATVLAPTLWYNIHFQFQVTTKIWSIYIGGVLDATGTADNDIAVSTAPWTFGAAGIGMAPAAFLDGQLDNFLRFNRLLTPTEITFLNNSGNGRAL